MQLESASRHLGAVGALALTIVAQPSVLDDRSVSRFLGDLQHSVARNDGQAVSALVQYPLTVFAGGVRIPIPDAAALLQNYDAVFSPALKAVIAQAAIAGRGRSAPAATVSVKPDYATIGVDAVRIEPVGGGIKITRITVPQSAPAADGAAGVSRRPAQAPERLVPGIGQVQRAGALAHGERDAYLLRATKNQLLEVRINGVRGRDIVARITGGRSGAPIDSRARDGARTWIGRVPEDGDYRIDVVRGTGGGDAQLPYLMVVSLR
jgi:hypothetical protein